MSSPFDTCPLTIFSFMCYNILYGEKLLEDRCIDYHFFRAGRSGDARCLSKTPGGTPFGTSCQSTGGAF